MMIGTSNMFYRSFVLMILVIYVICMQNGDAFNYCTCNGHPNIWSGHTVTMNVETASFAKGSTYDANVQTAMDSWSTVPGSDFAFVKGYDSNSSHALKNGYNEIYKGDAGGNYIAYTYIERKCEALFGVTISNEIVEADIVFDFSYSWSSGLFNHFYLPQWDYNGYVKSFEGVALHELGHVVGISHRSDRITTMNPYMPNGGPFGGAFNHGNYWQLHGDEAHAMRYLYSNHGATMGDDIAASAFRPHPYSGPPDGVVAEYFKTPVAGSIPRGGTVTIEYTIANRGARWLGNISIGFYISSNNVIEITDKMLTSIVINADAYAVGTFQKTLTIPSNLLPGRYWLGFIVDNTNLLPETNEGNNAQQMPYYIDVY